MWQRIKAARLAAGLTQAELGKACGVTRNAVSQWESSEEESRTNPQLERLKLVSDATKAPLDWLTSDESEINDAWVDLPDHHKWLAMHNERQQAKKNNDMQTILVWEDPEDLPEGKYVLIQRRRVHLSAGNGTMVFEEEPGEPLAFGSRWVKRKGLRHSDAVVVYAKGDSMEPSIHDGNALVVNLGERKIRDGKIYAIRYGDELRVKRLFRRYDGSLILRSDNTTKYPDEIVPPFDQNGHIQVLGRVISWTHDDD